MNTTEIGQRAEQSVANYLVKKGHKIVARNWKNRYCEIDIVSKTKKCVYFTEVKYRSSSDWGSGLDYITPKKLKQMKFAAEYWLVENAWTREVALQAAEVDNSFNIKLIDI